MKIPLHRLDESYIRIRERAMKRADRLFCSGMPNSTSVMRSIEEDIADRMNLKHPPVLVASGTAGIMACLIVFSSPGKDVMIPSHTFVSVAQTARLLGLNVRLIDSEKGKPHVDYASLSPEKSGLIPTSLYGVPCSTKPKGFEYVFEDASQSFDFELGSRFVGEAAVVSFYPTKIMGALGEAGMILSHDSNLLDEFRRVIDNGREDGVGINLRGDLFQAVILDEKMDHWDEWMERMRNIFFQYDDVFGEMSEVSVIHPEQTPHLTCYPIYFKEGENKRKEVQIRFEKSGIQTHQYWKRPLSLHPLFRADCPHAEDYCRSTFVVPFHPFMSNEEVTEVLDQGASFLS